MDEGAPVRCVKFLAQAVAGKMIVHMYRTQLPNLGLNTIKLLTLYSVNASDPLAFSKQPANVPDVISVENTLKQLKCLNLEKPLIVTDNDFKVVRKRECDEIISVNQCNSLFHQALIEKNEVSFVFAVHVILFLVVSKQNVLNIFSKQN